LIPKEKSVKPEKKKRGEKNLANVWISIKKHWLNKTKIIANFVVQNTTEASGVVHAYNPSYTRDQDWKDHSWRLAREKKVSKAPCQ
jgi:hypothetical protein